MSLLAGCGSNPLCSECNIVLITIDALRAGHLGIYGHVRDTSPRIDAFGREAIVFDQAIVGWPKTTPGLATILTGNFAHTVRMMYGTFDPMREDSTMLSEMLREKEYVTGGFTANPNLTIARGWNQGFDEYVELPKKKGCQNRTRRCWVPEGVTEHGLEFLARNEKKKFFLWLHHMDPHSPYLATSREFRHYFRDDEYTDDILYDEDRKRKLDLHTTPSYSWRTDGINGIPISVHDKSDRKQDPAHYIAEYDSEIRYTDHYVGKIFDDLKSRGLWETTVVVVAADHGEALGDHDLYFEHGRFAYDDVSRIPLILHVPGQRSQRIEDPVSSIDLVPTLLELVGLPQEWPTDGRSLVTTIEGREEGDAYVFNEAGYNYEHQTTVRDHTWKLIYVPAREARSVMQGELFELYNIKEDPLETVNLAAREPEVLERLRGTLFAWLEERKPPLLGYVMRDGRSTIYLSDYEFPNVAVEGHRFYARVAATNQRMDYCFGLAVPDPDAEIMIELLEGNDRKAPYAHGKQEWDDPELSESCVDDEWGCLRVNGKRVDSLPFSVRLGDLEDDGADPTYLTLHGEDNDKTFCFRAGTLKRRQPSRVGNFVEVMGIVEPGIDVLKTIDEETRQNLRELGYLD
jgi:arylsulfatase A-like enzyme